MSSQQQQQPIDLEDVVEDITETFSDIRAKLKAQKVAFRKLQRSGLPAIQSSLSSVADLAGSWLFLLGVQGSQDEALRSLEKPLLGFAALASVSASLSVGSTLIKHVPFLAKFGDISRYISVTSDPNNTTRTNKSGPGMVEGEEDEDDDENDAFEGVEAIERYRKITNAIQAGLGSEIILEDLPQFILTAMALRNKSVETRSLDSVAVFNLTTSAFNLLFNGLDMVMPYEEEEFNTLERAQTQAHVMNRTDNARTCRIFSSILARVGIIAVVIMAYFLLRYYR